MNSARKRKLLRKRRCYARSRVPVDLAEAIAESAREGILADWNDNLNFGTFDPGTVKLYFDDWEIACSDFAVERTG